VQKRSAVDAVGPALQRTRDLLLSPFDWRKWAKLALVSMLMGGAVGHGGFNFPSGGGPEEPDLGPARDWIAQHQGAVIGAALAFVLVVLALSLLFAYIASVMRFIFLDAVVHDRAEIRRGWHEQKGRGLSFFLFQLAVGLIMLGVIGLAVGLPLLLAYNAGVSDSWDARAAVGLVLAIMAVIFLTLTIALAVGVLMALTRDLVLPVMYVRNLRIMGAWSVVWPLVKADLGGVVVYLLLKVALGIVAGIAGLIVGIVGFVAVTVPLALLAMVVYLTAEALQLAWSWYWLLVIIPAGTVALVGIAYLINLLLLPIPVFFQAYALKYLGFLDESLATLPEPHTGRGGTAATIQQAAEAV
jgi:hypothetical protein